MNFKLWLESEMKIADFGFEKEHSDHSPKISNIDREHPIHKFDIEELGTYLSMRKLGPNPCYSPYVNEYIWGEDVGALRVRINTGLQLFVDRKAIDLMGNEKWLTKRSFQINREGYGGYEDVVASEVFNILEEVSTLPLDVPKEAWPNLERTVVNVANKLQRTAKNMLVFESILKLANNRYIIKFNVRAQGLETQDHNRVEENLTDISFDEQTGALRILNTNVESPTGKSRSWEIMPSDQDFLFFATQDNEEISEVISTPMKFY